MKSNLKLSSHVTIMLNFLISLLLFELQLLVFSCVLYKIHEKMFDLKADKS